MGQTSPFRGEGRKVRNRRVSPVEAHSGDRLLSQHIAGIQPCRREPLFVPHTCRSQSPSGSAQLAGRRPLASSHKNHTLVPHPDIPAGCLPDRQQHQPRNDLQSSPWVTVFGLSAANSVSALRFADVGLGGFLNGSNFILQHDEAIL